MPMARLNVRPSAPAADMLDDFADADWTDRPQAYRLTRLTLSDFRSYAALRLDLGTRSGRADRRQWRGQDEYPRSDLHADAPAAACDGRRSSGWRARTARGASAGDWAVSAEINGPDGALRLASGIDPNNGQRGGPVSTRRRRRSGALAGHLRLLWLTPANDGLFTGPSGDRRRFLDRFVTMLDPAHGGRLAALDKLLRQRATGCSKIMRAMPAGCMPSRPIWRPRPRRSPPPGVAAAQALARDVGHDRRGASSAFPFAGFELSRPSRGTRSRMPR